MWGETSEASEAWGVTSKGTSEVSEVCEETRELVSLMRCVK